MKFPNIPKSVYGFFFHLHAPHPLFVLPLNGGDFKEKKIELTQGGVSQPSGEDRMWMQYALSYPMRFTHQNGLSITYWITTSEARQLLSRLWNYNLEANKRMKETIICLILFCLKKHYHRFHVWYYKHNSCISLWIQLYLKSYRYIFPQIILVSIFFWSYALWSILVCNRKNFMMVSSFRNICDTNQCSMKFS